MNLGTFAPVSNRVSWTDTILAFDAEPGDIDITDAEITMVVRDKSCDRAVLTAEVDGGITINDGPAGEFTILFTKEEMRGLDAGTYNVGITITLADGSEDQLFIGTIEVKDGIV